MRNRDACRELTVRRSQRMALSTVNASRVAAGPAKLAVDLERVRIVKAVTGGTSGAPATPVAGVPNTVPALIRNATGLSGIPLGDR
jgi:hypothetical protein